MVVFPTEQLFMRKEHSEMPVEWTIIILIFGWNKELAVSRFYTDRYSLNDIHIVTTTNAKCVFEVIHMIHDVLNNKEIGFLRRSSN